MVPVRHGSGRSVASRGRRLPARCRPTVEDTRRPVEGKDFQTGRLKRAGTSPVRKSPALARHSRARAWPGPVPCPCLGRGVGPGTARYNGRHGSGTEGRRRGCGPAVHKPPAAAAPPVPHHPNPSSFRLLSSPSRRSRLARRSRPLSSRSSLSPVRLILASFPCSAVSMAFSGG